MVAIEAYFGGVEGLSALLDVEDQVDEAPCDIDVDISDETRGKLSMLVSGLSSEISTLPFYGPFGEIVNTEFCSSINPIPEEGRLDVTPYVFVGNRLFLNFIFKDLMDELNPSSEDEIVYFANPIVFANNALVYYSSLTSYALTQVDLKGKTFLDLGCADGISSLVAKLEGARKVIAVDKDYDVFSSLRLNLMINRIGHTDFRFITEDLTNDDLYQRLGSDNYWNRTDLDDVDIVCMNLGQGQYDGDPNKAAIALLDHMPNVSHVIGSGYATMQGYGPEEDVALLQSKGFRKIRWLVAQKPDCEEGRQIGFIAERNGPYLLKQ